MRPSFWRAALGALLAAGVATSASVVSIAPANALTRDTITVSKNNPVAEAEYPPIPGQFAQTTVAITPLPAGCGNDEDVSDADSPPTFGAMCDRVPLRIEIPTDLEQTDDYIVTITLSWNDSVGAAAGEDGTGNDLDMYVYDDRQVEQREDPESTSFTQQSSSATVSNPESVKLGSPALVDYNILVINASGANEGYKLKVEFRVAKGERIFELLEQGAKQQKEVAETPPDQLVVPDLSGFPNGGNDLIAVVPGFDLDFTDPGLAPLEAALQAPPSERIAIRRERPGPVSGMTLAFWLGVVPAGLLGGLALGLRRRGSFNLGGS